MPLVQFFKISVRIIFVQLSKSADIIRLLVVMKKSFIKYENINRIFFLYKIQGSINKLNK